MEVTAAAEALLSALGERAPAEDVLALRASAEQDAVRRGHPVLVRGHVVGVLLRAGADADLLRAVGLDPGTTAIQVADQVKAEVDEAAARPPGDPVAETPAVRPPETATTGAEPCPECGDTGPRRHEIRRTPRPGGGRGSVTARVVVCGDCGANLGVG